MILVSLDGFRWDYSSRVSTPHLDRLAARGVRAEGLVPVFPSKTFPAHYSIVTGLHPGGHGIVSNHIYDPELDAEFHLGEASSLRPEWWGGEPIWVTAERAGVPTAAMFWPGTEVEIDGVRPSHWHRFDTDFPFAERVAQVLSWLDLPPESRPRFVTLYFEEPNDTSHWSGPEGEETWEAVREVDRRLGELVAGIEARALEDRVDLVVVSDHGMAQVDRQRVVVVDDYVETLSEEVLEEGAFLQIVPGEGREELLYQGLRDAHPHLAVYRRDEIPERYRLRGHPRVAPIVGIPEVGWEAFTRRGLNEFGDRFLAGDHGQDPSDPRLHGLFVAAGPGVRAGVPVGRIASVDLYPFLMALLGLGPAPHDGDPEALAPVLRRPPVSR